MAYFDEVREAAEAIRAEVREFPRVAVVLGSGLGGIADVLRSPKVVRYDAVPHWPASTAPGHGGRLVVGDATTRRVAMLCGRAHLYEGHSARAVTFAVRVLGVLGVDTLLLTNAAGGINAALRSGALMIVDDHINLTGANPLAGPNDERFGPRFPDMSEVYSSRLRGLADDAAREAGVSTRHGVYAGLAGPSYETPAEIRYLRTIGADAVGMSTVHEAIAARHMGMHVLAVSCITNMAAGLTPHPLTHDEVLAAAAAARDGLARLLEGILERL